MKHDKLQFPFARSWLSSRSTAATVDALASSQYDGVSFSAIHNIAQHYVAPQVENTLGKPLYSTSKGPSHPPQPRGPLTLAALGPLFVFWGQVLPSDLASKDVPNPVFYSLIASLTMLLVLFVPTLYYVRTYCANRSNRYFFVLGLLLALFFAV